MPFTRATRPRCSWFCRERSKSPSYRRHRARRRRPPPGKVLRRSAARLWHAVSSSARAAEPSRVVRIPARHYYAAAEASPQLAQTVNALARERIGGLQGIAAEQRRPQVTMLGHRWDAVCLDLRRFLGRNQITFDWVTLDDPDLDTRWPAPLPSEANCPALRLTDGTTLLRPQTRQLAERLGLQTVAKRTRIRHDHRRRRAGGARRRGLRRLRGTAHAGRRARGARRPGRNLVADRELSRLPERHLRRRARQPGAAPGEAPGRGDPGDAQAGSHRSGRRARSCSMTAKSLRARTVIVATGVTWRRLAIDGFDRLVGKGIYYGAARSEAGVTQGLDVHLIGAGNSAGQAAMFFANQRNRSPWWFAATRSQRACRTT